jgi:PKD repeat protein
MEQLINTRIKVSQPFKVQHMIYSYSLKSVSPVNLFFWFLFFLVSVSQAQAPLAGFTVAANQGCAPFSVNFTNTSTNAVSYQWNFGNGNFSVLTNPQNVFVNPGNYNVVLTATSASGPACVSTSSRPLEAACLLAIRLDETAN